MIKYVQGDATMPRLAQREMGLIAHVCNDRGGWGRGFVLALSNRWAQPEGAYRMWHRTRCNEQGEPFKLGNIQYVRVDSYLYVVNMIAQAGYGGPTPLHLESLETCLGKVAQLAREVKASVHMPRIGTGLGGSSWEVVGPVVSGQLPDIPVTVYDLAKERPSD